MSLTLCWEFGEVLTKLWLVGSFPIYLYDIDRERISIVVVASYNYNRKSLSAPDQYKKSPPTTHYHQTCYLENDPFFSRFMCCGTTQKPWEEGIILQVASSIWWSTCLMVVVGRWWFLVKCTGDTAFFVTNKTILWWKPLRCNHELLVDVSARQRYHLILL